MKLRILNSQPLFDIQEAAYITLGKENVPEFTGNEYEYYLNRFIEKHSIIRAVRFRIKNKTRKTIIAQLIRATKGNPQPYVQSSRPDWNDGKPRDTSAEAEGFYGHDHTAESFMSEMGQRLCYRAERPTRLEAEQIVKLMLKDKNPYFRALGYCSVPNCFIQCSCPENRNECGYFRKMIEKATKEQLIDIKVRYAIYQRALQE